MFLVFIDNLRYSSASSCKFTCVTREGGTASLFFYLFVVAILPAPVEGFRVIDRLVAEHLDGTIEIPDALLVIAAHICRSIRNVVCWVDIHFNGLVLCLKNRII